MQKDTHWRIKARKIFPHKSAKNGGNVAVGEIVVVSRNTGRALVGSDRAKLIKTFSLGPAASKPIRLREMMGRGAKDIIRDLIPSCKSIGELEFCGELEENDKSRTSVLKALSNRIEQLEEEATAPDDDGEAGTDDADDSNSDSADDSTDDGEAGTDDAE